MSKLRFFVKVVVYSLESQMNPTHVLLGVLAAMLVGMLIMGLNLASSAKVK